MSARRRRHTAARPLAGCRMTLARLEGVRMPVGRVLSRIGVMPGGGKIHFTLHFAISVSRVRKGRRPLPLPR